MAFLLVPLGHDLPNVIVLLHPTATMKVDSAAEATRVQLLQMNSAVGFEAAGGDPGTNPLHRAGEAVYQVLPADVTLDRVIEALEPRERVRTRTGWEVTVTEMIHWLKRLRGRFLKRQEKGETLESVGGAALAHRTRGGCSSGRDCPDSLETGCSIVQYQDGPALDLFQIDKVLECIDAEAAAVAWSKRSRPMYDDEEDESSAPSLYGVARYLMPAAMIEAVVREPHLTRLTRLDLLQAAFTVLFGEIKRDKGEPTPWTTQQLYRGANLCVVLYRVLTRIDEPLALGRIGSHSLECHFGIVRAILRGDDRWERWLSAEVRAELAAEYIQDLDLSRVSAEDAHPSRGRLLSARWMRPRTTRSTARSASTGQPS
jgi:hypothetical protein